MFVFLLSDRVFKKLGGKAVQQGPLQSKVFESKCRLPEIPHFLIRLIWLPHKICVNDVAMNLH